MADRREEGLVLLAVAAAWAASFAGGYQFDDWNVVVNEPRVASLSAWWASLPAIRPLLKLTFALNRASGLGLAGFHAVNLALHAGSSLLVLALLRRVAIRCGPGVDRQAAPLLGALVFALHPVQSESVTYVSGRSSSLVALLALGSVLAWLAGREGSVPGWRASLRASVVSPALLALALGAKEGAVAVPAALVLLDAIDVRRPFRWRDTLRATLPHLSVLAGAALLVLGSPTYRRMLAASAALRTPWENLPVHAGAVAWLAGQVARVHAQVADPGLSAGGGWTLGRAAAAAVLLGGTAWALASVRRRPAIAFGVLWFLVWLPPWGPLLPRPDPASERQLYLALAGPAWLVGLLASPWFLSGGLRRSAVAAGLAGLGLFSTARSLVYADEVRFWGDAARKAPGNARAHGNLGFALAARCRLDEAEAALLRALSLDPGYLRAAINLRLLREGAPLGPSEPRCPTRPDRPEEARSAP